MFEAVAVVAALNTAGVAPRPQAPSAERMRLLERMTFSPLCFPDTLTDAELTAIVEEYDLRPPSLFDLNERFFTDLLVWAGDIGIGNSALAVPASLTYSFPADGVTWGLSVISSTGPNDLNSRFTTLFGAGNVDRGRELIRQTFASWAFYTGLSYREVADDGAVQDQVTARTATRGDIRVGGRPFGTSSFLAYNAFPSAAGLAGVGGGDMVINTSFFTPGNFSNATNNYRYFRNTVAHEHGHGTGNIHTTPCNSSKLMEPFIHTFTDMLTIDEIRGGSRSYGDRFAGNNSAGTAKDLGNLVSPQNRSVIEPFLSINGSAGPGGTNADWFKFTMTVNTTLVITVTPIGGNYQNGQQSSSCNPSNPPFVNASEAGNLGVELRDSTGVSVLLSANSNAAGVAEVINAGVFSAGTYTVRVFDNGPNLAANQTVQLYDLSIKIGFVPAAPLAIAGVDKRVQANTSCFFMGDISSRPLEPGATLNVNSYDWDLDGNGTLETLNQTQPIQVYVSNGVYPIKLRVTDSNGLWDEDTINVTVFGATTDLTSVVPNTGNQGTVVPVTFTGTNLKNVASAGEFFVLGGGVTVVGTPVPNALGTQVTGLSLQIDPGAAPGPRSVSVNNSDGFDQLAGAFTIVASCCVGNANGDNIVDFNDVVDILGNWLESGTPSTPNNNGDANCDGEVDFNDIVDALGNWLDACP